MKAKGRYAVLIAKLFANNIDEAYLARLLGKKDASVIRKRLSGEQAWKIDEMYAVCRALGEDCDQLHILFPPDEAQAKELQKTKLKAM